MAITVSNVRDNHRSLYWEYTGDGATKASVATLPLRLHPNSTGVATVTTAATSFEPGHKGGLNYPTNGTNWPATVSISGNTVTVTTNSAVTNAVKAYVVVVFDQYSD